MENYQIKLYGCENGHIINNISVNDFNKTQYIDESKIICDICKSANKKEQYNKVFNYCKVCKQKLCPLCKSKHNKSHIIIDYDKKIIYAINMMRNLFHIVMIAIKIYAIVVKQNIIKII